MDGGGTGTLTGAFARRLSTLISARPNLPAICAWIWQEIVRQGDHVFLWSPVIFGCGAALYFLLPAEPVAFVAWAVLGFAAALWVVPRRLGLPRSAILGTTALALGLAGFACAKLRTEAVRAPVAPGGAGLQTVQAYVVDIASPGQGGARLLLAPISVSRLAPVETPIRARMTLAEGSALPDPGDRIELHGMLNGPPPPASPGAYDFARDAFFEGIGGVGFALTPPRILPLGVPPPGLSLTFAVNGARWTLAKEIVASLGAERGGLAAAMVTGHEAFIPKTQVDDLRAAGLAHIISISGLHMAIVGGFTFALARLAIAAWPWLALRLPGKKIAAGIGIVAILSYLVLSGAPAPAERAAITAVVAFVAILFDRRALSLHTLAIAALVVLATQPEAVTEPGFQMSFAATTALVGLAEIWPRPIREINSPWPIRLLQGVGTWLGASLAASFVAGLATGPIAMQHFNRISTFGLVANLLVAPISSFLMMPALAIGALLAPFGWGDLPLAMAGWAIAAMNEIARSVAALPMAQLVVASAPGWTLPSALLGLFFICLWKGPLRWLGLPFALSVTLVPRPAPPDIWIAADASTLAVRDGRSAVLFRPDVKLFGAELWSRRRGLAPHDDELTARDAAFDCDRWSCISRPGASGPKVAAIWTRRAGTIDKKLPIFCQGAEVIVVRGEVHPDACPTAILLSAGDFRRGGSAELYSTPTGWKILWAQTLRGTRPWSLKAF